MVPSMTDVKELEKRKEQYIKEINDLLRECKNLKKLDLILSILKKRF